jgi:hypothetical protein
VENDMKMKIAALVLIVLLPVLAVTATYATKPAMGSGTVTLSHPTMVGSPRPAGDNTIATFKKTFDLTGTLTGTAKALERDVTHASGDKSFTTFHGEANFTGSANGLSGKLVISYVGTRNATFVHGQFVAGNGTGGLSDFHGQGSFSGKVGMGSEGGALSLAYTLKWHIDPAAERTKHSA